MLIDLALCLRDLLIELLDFVLLGKLLADEGLLLILFLLLHLLVTRDVLMQVHLVVFELLLGVDERLVTALLPLFKLFDLLLHGVIGELSKEHFFLLIHELCRVLSALLFRELNASLGNHHGTIDVLLLLLRVSRFLILSFVVALGRRDVAVLHSV